MNNVEQRIGDTMLLIGEDIKCFYCHKKGCEVCSECDILADIIDINADEYFTRFCERCSVAYKTPACECYNPREDQK